MEDDDVDGDWSWVLDEVLGTLRRILNKDLGSVSCLLYISCGPSSGPAHLTSSNLDLCYLTNR